MFKKAERLTRSQFDDFFRSGRRFQTEQLSLIYTPYSRRHIGVVVGKKVARKAHERNAIRRRVYGVLYRSLTDAKATGVYIILTKPSFASLTQTEQREAVQNILKRITLSRTSD
jgi:ribonuclease P protein component